MEVMSFSFSRSQLIINNSHDADSAAEIMDDLLLYGKRLPWIKTDNYLCR